LAVIKDCLFLLVASVASAGSFSHGYNRYNNLTLSVDVDLSVSPDYYVPGPPTLYSADAVTFSVIATTTGATGNAFLAFVAQGLRVQSSGKRRGSLVVGFFVRRRWSSQSTSLDRSGLLAALGFIIPNVLFRSTFESRIC
jgi:hypothetical protein